MFIKVATFLTVAVLLVQPGQVVPQYSPDPLVNSVIVGFVTNINNTLNNAISQTGFIAQQFYTQLKTFESQVQANVSKLCTSLDTQIATEVAKQGGISAKIYNCTKLSKPKLDAFANSTFNSLKGCATEKITLGITSVNNIFTALTNIYNSVANATQRLNTNCPPLLPGASITSQITYSFCITNAVARISAELSSYTLVISTNSVTIGFLIADIPNFPTQYATCISTRSTSALLDSLPIIGEIALCTITP